MRVAARRVRPTALDAGLARIREQFEVPAGFPPEVALAAVEAARATRAPSTSIARTGRSSRSIRRRRPTSTRRSPSSAPATTSCCTTPSPTSGSSSATATPSTRRRGGAASRCTCPTSGRGCTRRCCREGAASLLPDGPRPAVVFTVRVDPDGESRARRRRAGVIRSRAKLAYETVHAADLPAGFAELAAADRRRRGAPRRAARRVPRAGAGARRRPLGAALRAAPRERGPQRGAVAGDQPRRRRRAAGRRHRAVPRDARARRAGGPPPAPHRPRRSASTGPPGSRSPTSSARCDATTRGRRRS